jgi:6-pyruvoyltetrahydropterin/6-carboxytetrahydropterin synthase
MYGITVRTDFIAQHFLVGGDWGAENQLHAHHYVLELQLHGSSLDEHGYLVDIVVVDAQLTALRDRYRDRVLNELPEFAGLNPSLEHFARIAWQQLHDSLAAPNLSGMTVRLWENDDASAVYEAGLRPP